MGRLRRGNEKDVLIVLFLFSSFQLLFSQTTREIWLSSLEPKLHRGHGGGVTSVVFSPDGNFIVSGNRDNTINKWSVKTGQCFETFQGHSKGITAVDYSPNGKLIISGSPGPIKIWDAKAAKCLGTLSGNDNGIVTVTYSDDGRLITSRSYDRTRSGFLDQSIYFWDAKTGEFLTAMKKKHNVTSPADYAPNSGLIASGNGRYIVSGSLDSSTKIWKAATGECLATLYALNEEWLVTTPNGAFDASEGALDKMYFVRGLELIELEELKEEYYEPGLLAKIMEE